MMDQDVDTRFAHRLSLFEENLFDSIADRSSMATFNRQWLALVGDLNAAITAETLSHTTILAAHTLAQTVSGIFQTFLDLDILSENVMSSLALEASTILGPKTPVAVTPQTSDNLLTQPASPPSYIKPSYEWLLKNIHDPYPSVRTRDNIANETGSARKDVDSWFVDARKRIGWNALRKTRFSNKRIEIVDAATRFFIEDDPKRPLDPDVELKFAAIETRAKELYSEKFSESDLAVKLDTVVKDMTPEMKVLAKEEQYRRTLLQSEESISRGSQPISSYPSPDHSPNRSPEPKLPSPISYCNDTAPGLSKPSCSRKRNSCEDVSDVSANQPNKRFRLDDTSSAIIGLPSPASSFNEDLDDSDSIVAPAPPNPSSIPTSSRKRRLSDAGVQGAPKRPRNLPVGPRLQAMSNPLPMSSALLEASFDDWYKEHFELPNVACVDDLDPSIPLEVELCDTSIFNANALQQCLPISTPGYTITSSVSSPSSLPLETSTLPLDVFTSEFDFTDLAANHFTDIFQGQGTVDDHGFSLPFNIPPLDLDFPLNVFDPYTMPSMPLPTQSTMPVLPDSSAYVPAEPSSDANWPLSQLLPSLPPFQDTVSSNDKVQNIFSIFPPEDYSFDLGILNLAQPNNEVANTTAVDRATKERQLMEFKEAARKLEEELAAS